MRMIFQLILLGYALAGWAIILFWAILAPYYLTMQIIHLVKSARHPHH